MLTTYQDLGRPEMLQYALSISGAMDQTSLQIINCLLNNPPGAAALEVTLLGLKLKSMDEALIAVGGADLGFEINGRKAALWTVHHLEKEDVVSFKLPQKGLRAYLGVAGGFNGPQILGSCSVYLKGHLGSALKQGDIITSLAPPTPLPDTGRKVAPSHYPDLDTSKSFRVLPGPQIDHFSDVGLATFTESMYTVSTMSDRQGIRTEGTPVERLHGPDIITDPIPLGGIQVPGNGLPIILHRDAQVTGGYSKIAVLARVDLDRAGQLMPGDQIRFRFIEYQEALDLWAQQTRLLAEVQNAWR